VHVLQRDHVLDEIDLMAIDRAAAAISLALLAERDARSATDQARSALIRDVLSGRLASPEEFVRRAGSLGMNLPTAAVAVLAVEPRDLAELAETQKLAERERQEIRAATTAISACTTCCSRWPMARGWRTTSRPSWACCWSTTRAAGRRSCRPCAASSTMAGGSAPRRVTSSSSGAACITGWRPSAGCSAAT
jgi:hypothetical protein